MLPPAVTCVLQAPSLPCDRECGAQQRRGQLADAFGVPAGGQEHVPFFDRHRTPSYPPALVQVRGWWVGRGLVVHAHTPCA